MDIVVENFSKFYGKQRAVQNVSFAVKTGEVLGFLGPNGAGKTTTMKAIATYFAPTEGEIFVGNVSVRENPDEVKKHIGYLPENNPLYLDMGVVDYLQFVGNLHCIESANLKKRIREMIEVCGLKNEKHKKIGELSKGYRQRTGLAQALIHNPEVLILDEPTSGLDPNQIVEIRDLIRNIGKEKTVILSSHILAEVEATCNRILIIDKGKIVANGTAESLRKQAQANEMLHIVIEGDERNIIFEELKSLKTVFSVDFLKQKENGFEIQSNPEMSSKREIFSLCVQKNWFLTEMTPFETTLEDVFRQLTH